MKAVATCLFALCLLGVGAWVWVTRFDVAVNQERNGDKDDGSSTAPSIVSPVAEKSGRTAPANDSVSESVVTRQDATPEPASQPAYDAFADDPMRPIYSLSTSTPSTTSADLPASNATMIDPAVVAAAYLAEQAGKPPRHH